MIKMNFFDDTSLELLSKFCEYFKLDKEETNAYFLKINPDSLTPSRFVRGLNYNLTQADSSDLEIACRHMTTTEECDLEKFRTMGLLDLRSMLQQDTPLSSFLLEYGISVDVDNRQLDFRGKKHPITQHGELCVTCIRDKAEKCTGYSRCEYREKMDHLGLKLYHYGATVEYFMYSTLERMSQYSTIRRHPEILISLENVIGKTLNKYSAPFNLGYEWLKRKKKCYVLQFDARLSEMETYAPIEWRGGYDNDEVCFTLSGYTYSDYMSGNIPQRVFDNIGFLRWFFSIYFYDSEQMGSLLPSKIVLPEKLRFIEVN